MYFQFLILYCATFFFHEKWNWVSFRPPSLLPESCHEWETACAWNDRANLLSTSRRALNALRQHPTRISHPKHRYLRIITLHTKQIFLVDNRRMSSELSRSKMRRDEARRQTVFKSHSRNSCSNCKAHLRVTLLFYATAITRDDVENGDNCRLGLDPSEETRVDRGVEGARRKKGKERERPCWTLLLRFSLTGFPRSVLVPRFFFSFPFCNSGCCSCESNEPRSLDGGFVVRHYEAVLPSRVLSAPRVHPRSTKKPR